MEERKIKVGKRFGLISNIMKDRGSKEKADKIKGHLIRELKKENAFWSYQPMSINYATINDELLIAYTLRFLDLSEIDLLYRIFTPNQIKSAWKKFLVPEGEYLYTLNRFLAWYYFGAKKPDAYLKMLQTLHLNKLLKYERSN